MDRKWENIIRNDLPFALKRQQLEVVFQPLRKAETFELVGFESLIRWNHPLGTVPRKSFLYQAERSGESGRLGAFVLLRSLDQIVEWRHLRPDLELNVHVNVAHMQLLDGGFPNLVKQSLRRRSLEPAQLVLELTSEESLDDPLTKPALARLRDSGICIAADDVGSDDFRAGAMRKPEFSELIGEVKIDKSVVWELDIDLIHEIVTRAHVIGAPVVAEGIQSDLLLKALPEFGADILQGYMDELGRPMNAADATLLVTNEPRAERVVIDRSQDFGAEL